MHVTPAPGRSTIARGQSEHHLPGRRAGIDGKREWQTLGTLSYMSPNQVLRRSVDWRSDFSSIGCAFYFAVTGVPPSRNEPAVATATERITGVLEPPILRNPRFPTCVDRESSAEAVDRPRRPKSQAARCGRRRALRHCGWGLGVVRGRVTPTPAEQGPTQTKTLWKAQRDL